MKTPVTMSAERESVVKNNPGLRLIPRSQIFESSLNRRTEIIKKRSPPHNPGEILKNRESKTVVHAWDLHRCWYFVEGVMPVDTKSPEIKTELIEGVPFYFLSRAIADQIKKKRETIALIEVRQGAGRFFTITVKSSENSMLRRRIAER